MTTPTLLFPILESLDFDVKSGIELCGGDDQFYSDLIHELYADVLAKREAALRGDDLRALREYAHMLKGTLQVLGETNASMKARSLELALREGEPHQDLSVELAYELDKLHHALEVIFRPTLGS